MSKIIFKEEHLVGIKEIDDQHKQLISVINDLYANIQEGADNNEVKEIYQKLIDYAGTHFETEEKYFKKYKYKDSAKHIEEHEKFKEKIKELKKESTDLMNNCFNLLDYLEDWLVDHLITQDQKYSEFLLKKGAK